MHNQQRHICAVLMWISLQLSKELIVIPRRLHIYFPYTESRVTATAGDAIFMSQARSTARMF